MADLLSTATTTTPPLSLTETRFSLGDTLTIPAIGFGTFMITNDDVEAAVTSALALGYRHIDTAEVYFNEIGVGRAIAKSNIPREKLFITTKLWPGGGPSHLPVKGFDETVDELHAQVDKLGVDYVDLYIIHAPFGGPEGRLEQVLM
jgi:2,5-diketo-D-gluconate reductase A